MEKAGLVAARELARGRPRHRRDDDRQGLRPAGPQAAPTHVNGVRDYLVDLASAEDFAALGRVMDAVADHLVAGHPEMEIR